MSEDIFLRVLIHLLIFTVLLELVDSDDSLACTSGYTDCTSLFRELCNISTPLYKTCYHYTRLGLTHLQNIRPQHSSFSTNTTTDQPRAPSPHPSSSHHRNMYLLYKRIKKSYSNKGAVRLPDEPEAERATENKSQVPTLPIQPPPIIPTK